MRKTFWQTLDEAWPEYLAHHRDPRNRAIHLSADAVVLGVGLPALLAGRPKLALAALATGYAMVLAGHAIEGSPPMTLRHPVLAAFSNWRMFALAVTGRLEPELRARGIVPTTAAEPA